MDETLDQLQHIAATISEYESMRAPAIREARDAGATWEKIAAALHMSRAGVIKLHNSYLNTLEG